LLIKGQELICAIDRLGYMGEGIFHHEGQVGFVPLALPGETVRVVIEKVSKTHVFARLHEVESSVRKSRILYWSTEFCWNLYL